MLNSAFPTGACPTARVVKSRQGQGGEGGHGLPALREALGAWRVPVTGRKGCGLNSARRTALRPRGRPWVPGGDKASASSSNAGSRALGLAGHMALASGASTGTWRRVAKSMHSRARGGDRRWGGAGDQGNPGRGRIRGQVPRKHKAPSWGFFLCL